MFTLISARQPLCYVFSETAYHLCAITFFDQKHGIDTSLNNGFWILYHNSRTYAVLGLTKVKICVYLVTVNSIFRRCLSGWNDRKDEDSLENTLSCVPKVQGKCRISQAKGRRCFQSSLSRQFDCVLPGFSFFIERRTRYVG